MKGPKIGRVTRRSSLIRWLALVVLLLLFMVSADFSWHVRESLLPYFLALVFVGPLLLILVFNIFRD